MKFCKTVIAKCFKFGENFLFERACSRFCGQNSFFELFKFLRYISFAVHESLFSLVAIRHFVRERLGHFDIIAENFVVSDFESAYSRLFSFFAFKFCKPLFCADMNISHLIELVVITFLDVSAVLITVYAVSVECAVKDKLHLFERIQCGIDFFEQCGLHSVKRRFHFGYNRQSVAYRKQIFRSCVAIGKSAVESFKVARTRKCVRKAFSARF